MKHEIIRTLNLKTRFLLLTIKLIPENKTEIEAIKQTGAMIANEVQKNLIENYLILNLTSFSVLNVEKQIDSEFILKVFIG